MVNSLTKAYHIAIRLLAPRARSIHEMHRHLKKKGFDEGVILDTLERLEKENLLNDHEFAAMFIEQRERFNPKSAFALSFELKKKGIDETIIQDCLEGLDEYESAWRAVAPKVRIWHPYDPDKFKKKVMNYLRNRGFGYDVCKTAYERAAELQQKQKETLP